MKAFYRHNSLKCNYFKLVASGFYKTSLKNVINRPTQPGFTRYNWDQQNYKKSLMK